MKFLKLRNVGGDIIFVNADDVTMIRPNGYIYTSEDKPIGRLLELTLWTLEEVLKVLDLSSRKNPTRGRAS